MFDNDLEFIAEKVIEFYQTILAGIVGILAIVTYPLWIIPYLLWKHYKNNS